MKEGTGEIAAVQQEKTFNSVLEEVLRSGAQQMLAKAVESEVADYVESNAHLVDEEGHRLVVRNGHLRELVTGQYQHWIGEIVETDLGLDARLFGGIGHLACIVRNKGTFCDNT